jgi:hypothetical protein
LLILLQKYENIFHRILGEYNIEAISLQLKDKGVKSIYVCPYTVPRVVEHQVHSEIARSLDIGVLEEDYTSEWVPPKFSISNKMEP